jgi:hypothetical protein
MHNLIVKFLNQVAFVVRFVPFVVTGHKMYSYVCEGVSVVSLLVFGNCATHALHAAKRIVVYQLGRG